LDGAQNITITGNETMANLTEGLHSITVYANDTFGNMGASVTVTFDVTFNVASPFPTVPIAVASGASLAAVGIGLLVYFKKRRH
jgi:hypothetical protein